MKNEVEYLGETKRRIAGELFVSESLYSTGPVETLFYDETVNQSFRESSHILKEIDFSQRTPNPLNAPVSLNAQKE